MITQNILNLYGVITTVLTWFMNINLVEFKMGALVFFIMFIYVAVWFVRVMAKRSHRGVKR